MTFSWIDVIDKGKWMIENDIYIDNDKFNKQHIIFDTGFNHGLMFDLKIYNNLTDKLKKFEHLIKKDVALYTIPNNDIKNLPIIKINYNDDYFELNYIHYLKFIMKINEKSIYNEIFYGHRNIDDKIYVGMPVLNSSDIIFYFTNKPEKIGFGIKKSNTVYFKFSKNKPIITLRKYNDSLYICNKPHNPTISNSDYEYYKGKINKIVKKINKPINDNIIKNAKYCDKINENYYLKKYVKYKKKYLHCKKNYIFLPQ